MSPPRVKHPLGLAECPQTRAEQKDNCGTVVGSRYQRRASSDRSSAKGFRTNTSLQQAAPSRLLSAAEEASSPDLSLSLSVQIRFSNDTDLSQQIHILSRKARWSISQPVSLFQSRANEPSSSEAARCDCDNSLHDCVSK